MAKKFSVSRSAIWRAIHELKKEGYQINAVPNKGYQLSLETDLLSPEGIKVSLKKEYAGIKIIALKTVDSTNQYAKNKMINDAEHGTAELKKLKLDHIYLNYITPFPGTPFYKDCERKELIGDYEFEYYDCYSPIVGAKLPDSFGGLAPRSFRQKMQKKLNYNIVYVIKVFRNIITKYSRYIIYKFKR